MDEGTDPTTLLSASHAPPVRHAPSSAGDAVESAPVHDVSGTYLRHRGELFAFVLHATRDHALAGRGPVLLHLRTFRLTGHYVGDPQVYRDKEQLKRERETKDPIRLLGARLELRDEEFAPIDAEVTAEVEAAVEFAKAGTDPNPEDGLKYVYA